MFSKVLVAYDGSELSKKGLQMALEFRKLNPALHIEIIHVYQFPTVAIGEGMFSPPPTVAMDVYNQAEEVLAEAKEIVAPVTSNYNLAIEQGAYAKHIVDHANATNCDVIIIGSRGLSGLKEYFLGSVSHNVVQTAEIPVIVVK